MTISTATVKSAKVTLTAAQLQDIVANPVNLIPAPGVGKTIQPLSVSIRTNHNGTSYTDGLYADLCYGPAANDTPCQVADRIAFSVLSGISNFTTATPLVNGGVAETENQPINFTGPYNFTGNGGNVVVNVVYVIVSIV